MTAWFVARLRDRWPEVNEELPALATWLPEVAGERLIEVERAGSRYAIRNGLFGLWMDLCERGLVRCAEAAERSNLLFTLARVARRAGALDRSLEAATEKEALDRGWGAEREAAIAAGGRADVLQVRGEVEEALRIWREEALPVFERLGDVRERAVTLGRIADVLQVRGEVEEAPRIRREEELPATSVWATCARAW